MLTSDKEEKIKELMELNEAVFYFEYMAYIYFGILFENNLIKMYAINKEFFEETNNLFLPRKNNLMSFSISNGKKEKCNNCKYFSICNFSNFDSFLINNKVMGISININKAEFKLLSNKTKSICLSNKKYGCIKSIDKFSNVILDLEEGIKQAEEKIITMKKTKNTLTKEMCKIIEGE